MPSVPTLVNVLAGVTEAVALLNGDPDRQAAAELDLEHLLSHQLGDCHSNTREDTITHMEGFGGGRQVVASPTRAGRSRAGQARCSILTTWSKERGKRHSQQWVLALDC